MADTGKLIGGLFDQGKRDAVGAWNGGGARKTFTQRPAQDAGPGERKAVHAFMNPSTGGGGGAEEQEPQEPPFKQPLTEVSREYYPAYLLKESSGIFAFKTKPIKKITFKDSSDPPKTFVVNYADTTPPAS